MKAVISSTYNDIYLWNLPLVTYLWNKIGVDVICFVPVERYDKDYAKIKLAMEYCNNYKLSVYQFSAPEHKESTYAQCSRLYAACLNLPEDEILITSDADMGVFGEYLKQYDGNIQLFGADLLEGEKMYPMCYCSMSVKQWRDVMHINWYNKTYQFCLDEMLGGIEADHFRGNYWCADQEKLFNAISTSIIPITKHSRAKLPERFATKRLDRDDAFVMERDVTDIIDFHLPRPGYDEKHFEQILTIIKKKLPDDNFDWLIDYTNAYKQLL